MRENVVVRILAVLAITCSACLASFVAASTKEQDDEATRWSSYSELMKRSHSNSASFQNENLLLQAIWTALRDRGAYGRIYYQTECSHEPWEGLPFNRIKTVRPSKGSTGIAGLREMFASNRSVKAVRDPSGMIRITIGDVSPAILQTKIRRVALSGVERYDAASAIDAIQETPEIKAAQRKFHMGPPEMISNGGPPLPEEESPHLPRSLHDVTFDQALDIVARTFGGFVFYGECKDAAGTHLYHVYQRDRDLRR